MIYLALLAFSAVICGCFGEETTCLIETEKQCIDKKMENVNMKKMEEDFDECCKGGIGIETFICLKDKHKGLVSDCVNIQEKWMCFTNKLSETIKPEELIEVIMGQKDCDTFKSKLKELGQKLCTNHKGDPDIDFICKYVPK